jgi:3-hydroxyisobutyrate dehydrogenase
MAAPPVVTLPTIGFLGLGNMGLPMARNLRGAGYAVVVHDPAVSLASEGWEQAASPGAVQERSDIVLSVLPGGDAHRALFLGPAGLATRLRPGQLLVDCSTIAVGLAKEIAAAARGRGGDALDAPISGGARSAAMATLTFMAGGSAAAFDRARPLLAAMGRTIVHTGDSGTGQAAKICNNLMFGIAIVGMCEAFALAERLGLAPEVLFEIGKTGSSQSWAMTHLCPIPGLVPESPASHGYRPGGTSAMLLKDLKLAQAAVEAAGTSSPLGAAAAKLYQAFCDGGHGDIDASAIIAMIREKPRQ